MTLLRDLLLLTRDGEWGAGEPGPDLVRTLVIRGTDFPRTRSGDTSTIPTRYLPDHVLERKRLQSGDVLIETAGGTKDQPTGRTLLITPELLAVLREPTVCASFARFMRPDNTRVDSGYLFWWLQHLYITGQLDEHQVQHTGVARFQYTRFAETTHLHLPSLLEQRGIVAVLNALEDKIILNRRLNLTLEETARALFKSWFVDFDPVRAKAEGRQPFGMDAATAALFPDGFEESELADVPKGWVVHPLANLLGESGEIQTGPFGSQLHASDYEPQGTPVIMPTNIANRRIDDSDIARVNGAHVRRLSVHQVREGDVIYSRRGDVEKHALVGKTEEGWLCGTGCLRVRPGGSVDPHFLSLWLDLPMSRSWISARAVGATMPNLNTSILGEVPILGVPLSVQAAFADVAAPLDMKVQAVRAESRSLAELRDYLLPKLLSGEIRVKEAEHLLEQTP